MTTLDPRRIEPRALERRAFCEHQHSRFGRAIGAIERHPDQTSGRGNVDDRTAAAGHRADGMLDAEEYAVEIDRDHPTPFVKAGLHERIADARKRTTSVPSTATVTPSF